MRATEDGLATASMATYYAQRASAGLIISEGIWPNAVGQSNPRTPGLTAEAIGPSRVGIRLSPGSGLWGADETEVADMYIALLTELARLDIGYVHLEATTNEEVLVKLRAAWAGVLIMNPVFPLGPKTTGKSDAEHWLGLGADLIGFGRAFIANPDLVERLRNGSPIEAAEEASYFEGADDGYITYPSYRYAA